MSAHLTDFTNDPLEATDRWPEIKAAVDGGAPVGEVAESFGVSVARLSGALRRTGARGRSRIVRRLTADDGQPPATCGGADPPPKPRRTRKAPRTDAMLDGFKNQLGKVPDTEIAEKAGLSMWVVRGYRIRQGIAAFRRSGERTRRKPAPTKGRRKAQRSAGKPSPGLQRVATLHSQVGARPDHEVAEMAGVSVGTVRNYRKRHAIGPAPHTARASSKQREPEPPQPPARMKRPKVRAPVRVDPPPTPRTSTAWRVVFESGEERIAISDTLVETAEQIAGSGLGGAQRIERLGVALLW